MQAIETDSEFVLSSPFAFSDLQRPLNTDCPDENVDPATVPGAYAWILPYLSTASPAFCTPLNLMLSPWFFHGSSCFKQPLYHLTFAYLIAHCIHAFHLRVLGFRAMTSRTFNSSARNGYRKPPGSFVTKRRRGAILSEKPLFSYRNLGAFIQDSRKDPPRDV